MTGLPVPALSTTQVQSVDHLMVDEFGIEPLQTMENAGYALATLARTLFDGDVFDRSVVVLAGRGNNGGAGLAAARHLLNWGAWVQVVCADSPAAFAGVPARQLATLQAMAAPLAWAEDGWELPPADMVIDAIIGCGLRGAPYGAARSLIQLANSSAAPILSLDAPSGVESDTGYAFEPHVKAAATLALGLPRRGFLQEAAACAAGQLFLADIGVPNALYTRIGVEVACLFACNSIVELGVVDGGFVIDN